MECTANDVTRPASSTVWGLIAVAMVPWFAIVFELMWCRDVLGTLSDAMRSIANRFLWRLILNKSLIHAHIMQFMLVEQAMWVMWFSFPIACRIMIFVVSKRVDLQQPLLRRRTWRVLGIVQLAVLVALGAVVCIIAGHGKRATPITIVMLLLDWISVEAHVFWTTVKLVVSAEVRALDGGDDEDEDEDENEDAGEDEDAIGEDEVAEGESAALAAPAMAAPAVAPPAAPPAAPEDNPKGWFERIAHPVALAVLRCAGQTDCAAEIALANIGDAIAVHLVRLTWKVLLLYVHPPVLQAIDSMILIGLQRDISALHQGISSWSKQKSAHRKMHAFPDATSTQVASAGKCAICWQDDWGVAGGAPPSKEATEVEPEAKLSSSSAGGGCCCSVTKPRIVRAKRAKSGKVLPCGHIFHSHCILEWERANGGLGKCPVCAQSIFKKADDDGAAQQLDRERGENRAYFVHTTLVGEIRRANEQLLCALTRVPFFEFAIAFEKEELAEAVAVPLQVEVQAAAE